MSGPPIPPFPPTLAEQVEVVETYYDNICLGIKKLTKYLVVSEIIYTFAVG